MLGFSFRTMTAHTRQRSLSFLGASEKVKPRGRLSMTLNRQQRPGLRLRSSKAKRFRPQWILANTPVRSISVYRGPFTSKRRGLPRGMTSASISYLCLPSRLELAQRSSANICWRSCHVLSRSMCFFSRQTRRLCSQQPFRQRCHNPLRPKIYCQSGWL